MKKRATKIREQLIAEAKNKSFYKEMVLYTKEAKALREEGFTVDRVFSDEFDHPERNSFLYNISWKHPKGVCCFACYLREIALSS